jgi:hypothetical protein
MKLGMYIMAPEPISTAYFINPLPSVCVSMCIPPIVARQRLGKNVTAATKTQTTTEELLDASISMQSVSYQRKVSDWFLAELLIFQCLRFSTSREKTRDSEMYGRGHARNLFIS